MAGFFFCNELSGESARRCTYQFSNIWISVGATLFAIIFLGIGISRLGSGTDRDLKFKFFEWTLLLILIGTAIFSLTSSIISYIGYRDDIDHPAPTCPVCPTCPQPTPTPVPTPPPVTPTVQKFSGNVGYYEGFATSGCGC